MRKHGLAISISLFIFILHNYPAKAATAPSSDPIALSILQKAELALTGGNRLDDLQLKGTVHWRAGSEDLRGPADLQASSSGRSRIDLEFGSKKRIEAFSGDNEDPSCTWTDKDKATRPIATHNCWTPGAWFFPMLSILPAQQRGNILITYVGRDCRKLWETLSVPQPDSASWRSSV